MASIRSCLHSCHSDPELCRLALDDGIVLRSIVRRLVIIPFFTRCLLIFDCSLIGLFLVAEGRDVNEPGARFNSRGLGLRAQKKILGKMASKKIVKAFIDDEAGALLDAVHTLARRELETERQATKLVKNIIKVECKLFVYCYHLH